MKSKKIILFGVLAIFSIFSSIQVLGKYGPPARCNCAEQNHPIRVQVVSASSSPNKPTHQKVNIAALEERLSALYPR